MNKDRLGLKYGMSLTELLEAQTNYMKGIGRQVGLDGGDTETLAAITKVFGDASDGMTQDERWMERYHLKFLQLLQKNEMNRIRG